MYSATLPSLSHLEQRLAVATLLGQREAPARRRFWLWWLGVTVAGLLLSLFIEIAQLAIPSRVTDVDDVILNTLGTAAGACWHGPSLGSEIGHDEAFSAILSSHPTSLTECNMIDLTVHPDRLERAVKRARERNIIIPTFKQMQNPALIPEQDQGGPEKRRLVGRQPAEPLPHHLAQRAGRRRAAASAA